MKKMLAVIVMITLSAVFAFAECSEADKKALKQFDQAWGEADTRAALEHYYADDYRGIGPLGTSDREQALTNIPPFDPNVISDHYVITCTPNTATIAHRVKVKSDSGVTYGRAIHFLEKRGGKWKAVSSTGHPMNNEGHILALEMDLGPAFVNRDVAWFDRHVADNYIGANFDGKREDKKQLLDRVKTYKYSYDMPIKMSDVAIRMNGDAATIIGVYHLTGKDEKGAPFDREMHFSRMYVKKDGVWKIVADQDYLAETKSNEVATN